MFVLIVSYIDILSPFLTYERPLDYEDAAALPMFYFLVLPSSKNLDLPCNIGYLYFSLLFYHSVHVYIKVKVRKNVVAKIWGNIISFSV
jgi:hypothetical protein